MREMFECVVASDLIGVFWAFAGADKKVCHLFVVTPTKRWIGCTQLRMGGYIDFTFFAIIHNTFRVFLLGAVDAMSRCHRTPRCHRTTLTIRTSWNRGFPGLWITLENLYIAI